MAEIFLHSPAQTPPVPVTIGRARLQRLAKHWHYVLRSRRRWINDPKLRQVIEERATDHLRAIGVGPTELAGLSGRGMIEVRIDSTAAPSPNSDRWEARLLP